MEVPDAEFDRILLAMDHDRDGLISFAELVQWFAVFDAQQAFERFDKDGSGDVDVRWVQVLVGK
jgi:Ca2+-binding EF-hand superfamily protein